MRCQNDGVLEMTDDDKKHGPTNTVTQVFDGSLPWFTAKNHLFNKFK